MKKAILKTLVIIAFPIWLLPMGIYIASLCLSEMADDAINWFEDR